MSPEVEEARERYATVKDRIDAAMGLGLLELEELERERQVAALRLSELGEAGRDRRLQADADRLARAMERTRPARRVSSQ